MRVAIVNDLLITTEALRRLVTSDPSLSVAWTAADGAAALEACAADLPDLILMDIIMPGMDGVETTRRIMRETPCPILIVTTTIEGHLDRVYRALGAGALDAVECPTFRSDGSIEGGEHVLRKIRILERLRGRTTGVTPVGTLTASTAGTPRGPPPPPPTSSTRRGEAVTPAAPDVRACETASHGDGHYVLLGSSTGGPEVLQVILRGLSKGFTPPIVVVQHLDPEFVPGLVDWLAHETGRRVRAAVAGECPEKGTVLVACTSDHLVFARDGSLRYTVDPVDEPHRPSVDAFFTSAAAPAVLPGVAVVLTGMGRDGAKGLLRLRQAGWRTFAQDAATSVVYGMPRAAKEAGGAQQVVALPDMAARIEKAWQGLASAREQAQP